MLEKASLRQVACQFQTPDHYIKKICGEGQVKLPPSYMWAVVSWWSMLATGRASGLETIGKSLCEVAHSSNPQ